MELGREEEGGGREDKLEEGVEDSDDYYFWLQIKEIKEGKEEVREGNDIWCKALERGKKKMVEAAGCQSHIMERGRE